MKNIRAITVLAATLTLAAPVHAELNAYMTVRGQHQGEIKGSAVQKGREGKIVVIAVDHSLVAPTDAASGMATGRLQHKPLLISKEVDRASIGLHNALINNERLSEVSLQFWQPQMRGGLGGSEAMYYSITLKNARVVSLRHVMPNNRDPALATRAAYEEVGLLYENITWTWSDGGMSASAGLGGQP
jgi:type VI secretion system secreted protein Hcp